MKNKSLIHSISNSINYIFKYKLILFLSILTIHFNCEDVSSNNDNNTEKLLFIASEGNFGQGNGSISVFKDNEKIQEISGMGDVLQSILIHDNHLFAILNGSSEIKRYSISDQGLTLPGITISTESSSPREMIVLNNKLYFSNWNSKDIKILNLNTYAIEGNIVLEGLPEDIVSDGANLYVSIPHLALYDQGNGTNVVKIDPNTNQVIQNYEVGRGPQQMVIYEDNLIVSSTIYSDN